jgi:sulfoxide reductase heme-binding subunit YedZ
MKTVLILAVAAVAGAVLGGAFGAGVASWLLPAAGSHGAWYASRAAGLTSYLLLWAGLAGGLLMSSAWFDGVIGRARLLAFHQTATILGVLLGLAHGLVMLADGWAAFGLIDVLVPFGSPYHRPLTALGPISLYLAAIVSGSFWLRSLIGVRTWKLIHLASFAAFFAALWHGINLGTDTAAPWALGLYLSTSVTVVGALVVRVSYTRPRRQPAPAVRAVARAGGSSGGAPGPLPR